MSQERVEQIARRAGRNPYEPMWWQGARLYKGTGEYKYLVGEAGAPRKRKTVERGMLRGRGQSRYEARQIAQQSARGGSDLPF